MNQVAAIERLRRVGKALAAGQPPEPDDAAVLADAIGQYMSAAAPSLDAALSLVPAPGQRDPRTLLALTARDNLLRV